VDIFIKGSIGLGFVGLGYTMGAAYETEGMYGISHLMEHLGCKPFDSLLPKIKRLNIRDNAYTSDNKLVFWFSGLEENLVKVVPEAIDRILAVYPSWDKEAFENERSTVVQEYMDCFNSQESGFYENIMRRYYGHYGAIGKKEDIKNLTYEQSVKIAYNNFSKPAYLSQVGSKRIINLPIHSDVKRAKSLKFKEEGYGFNEEVVAKSDKTVVGLLGKNPMNISDATILNFIMVCLNDGLESPLYQEIRDLRGLSYYSMADLNIVGSTMIPVVMATTSNDRALELSDVYRNFFTGDITRHITKERFEDCKEYFVGKKKISNILSHSSAGPNSLKDFDEFDGIENLTHASVLEVLEASLHLDNFQEVSY